MSDLEFILNRRAQLLVPVDAAARVVDGLLIAQAKLDKEIAAATSKLDAIVAVVEGLGRQRVELGIRLDAAQAQLADVRGPLDVFDRELDVVRKRLN